MSVLDVKGLRKDLKAQGFTDPAELQKIEDAVENNVPASVYNKAVLFLGWATIILVVGCVWIALDEKNLPPEVWGLIGAGLGGLAGIFTGNN